MTSNNVHKYLASAPHTRNFLESLRERGVVIYGGGKIGTRICAALTAFGIRPLAIWDRKAAVIDDIQGIPVTFPTPDALEQHREAVVLVTVFSENASQQVRTELLEQGMREVVSKRSLLNGLLYLDCHEQGVQGRFRFDLETCHLCPVAKESHSRCDIYSRHIAELAGSPASGSGHSEQRQTQEPFVIPSMGVLVTNHCNLTCEGCNHLRDLYQPSDHVRLEPDVILDDLSRLLAVVDLIEKVVVVGGEALVHSDIDIILERILRLPRIGLVQIITNGTVIPKSPRLLAVLANPRVLVEISGYEAFLPEALRANVKRFLELLKTHGVRHKYVETLDWQDFGGFEHRGYSRKELRKVYRTCCFVSNDLFDGKLFKCSRSVFATKLGRIPDYPQDYVDVRNTPTADLREALSAFFANQSPEVCQHCDGTAAERVAAGVQVSGTKNAPLKGPHSLPILSTLDVLPES